MTEISDRYRRRAARIGALVDAVPAGDPRWAAPSPCPGWAAADVVDHLAGSHRLFFSFVGHPPPDAPPAAGDPQGAWAASRDAMVAALEDPAIAAREYEGLFGTMRFDDGIDRFVSFDLVVHSWDLARALGLDDRLDPDDVSACWEAAHTFGDAMRSPTAFGPALEPPAGADDQDRLLAFLGRDPRWTPGA